MSIVLVSGVGSHNGGAELMLYAAAGEVRRHGDVPVADMRRTDRRLLGAWGVGRYLSVPRLGRAESLGLAALPRPLQRAAGVSSSSGVDAVLDASGYAFGDKWPLEPIRLRAAIARRWARRGLTTVYLPQSFGPFEDPEKRELIAEMLSNAALICARDEESFAHLQGIGLATSTLITAPDITIGVRAPEYRGEMPGDVAIIPNVNLVERSQAQDARGRYVASLTAMAAALVGHGLRPFLLVHSRVGDPEIAQECHSLAPWLTVTSPRDGLEAKAVLARCAGVVSGRYHGLVSALSSGVPSIGHSWSHKYEHLLADFGAAAWLAEPFDGPASAEMLIGALASKDFAADNEQSVHDLRGQVRRMWEQVERILW